MRRSPFWYSLDPRIYGLRLSILFKLYRLRLKTYPVSEFMAGGGIAVGVALVFGVLVANTSIVGSSREILHDVYGAASLELAARSSQGFDETLANRAARLPGIKDAAFLLRQDAIIRGPAGNRAVQLVGVTSGLVGMEGAATQNLGAGALLVQGGIGLPSGVAHSIGARTEATTEVLSNGYIHTARVRAILGEGSIGAVAASGITVALLPYAQQLTGQRGRVTNVLIRTRPGRMQQVVRELRALAGNKLDVVPADNELRVVQDAAAPTTQSTTLFIVIAIMVGLLLALSAMLLTMPDRRRLMAEMREQGYGSKQMLVILAFQAGLLGIVASVVGIFLGYGLANTLFDEVPDYIAIAFPASGHETVPVSAVLKALGCGVVAAMLASMAPVFDLRDSKPVDAVLHERGEPGQHITSYAARRAAVAGVALVVLVTIIALVDSHLTAAGGVFLALATLCFVPLAFRGATRAMRYIARKYHGGMIAVARIELENTAMRAALLAGIAALAIYGSVAVGGARNDLIHGVGQVTKQDYDAAQIWVFGNDKNIFDTDNFPTNKVAAIAGAPGVASVRAYQGGYLDDGSRRLWIRARPPDNGMMLLSSQLIQGNLSQATARLRQGGWAAISEGFANEHHVVIGNRFTLPTPAGYAPFKVAAITTNVGWPPGAISINTNDYRRWWGTTNATALAIDLKPGITFAAGKRAVSQAIGDSGLQVVTNLEHMAYLNSEAKQGLQSLTEISDLLLFTAALALVAALWTTLDQRRGRLRALKEVGYQRRHLWSGLLIESGVVLGIGCIDGALLGLYGHALADRFLRLGTGFPAPFSLGVLQALVTLAIVVGGAMLVILLPGYYAAGISTETPQLQE
jgi:putative ABC transport system permease protein